MKLDSIGVDRSIPIVSMLAQMKWIHHMLDHILGTWKHVLVLQCLRLWCSLEHVLSDRLLSLDNLLEHFLKSVKFRLK